MPELNDRSMQDLKPTVWIGKQGCTDTMIEEIVSQLKKRNLIKVKWLQNADVDPGAVAARAKARLVEVRGRTMVLADKGKTAGKTGISAKAPVKGTAKVMARAALKSSEKPKAPASSKDDVKGKSRQTGALKRAKK